MANPLSFLAYTLYGGRAWWGRAGLRSNTWLPTKNYYFAGQKHPKGTRQRNNGVLSYLHGDHPSAILRASLLSTATTSNGSGTVTGNMQYTAYGRYRGGSEAATENRFTGQKLDDSGLYYYMVRQAHQPTPATVGERVEPMTRTWARLSRRIRSCPIRPS